LIARQGAWYRSTAEYNDTANPKSLKNEDGTPHPMAGKKDVVWFALSEDRPLCAFAGIWTEWVGARGTKANRLLARVSYSAS
jgi:putative SOS response-associated peptidase YedK